MPFYQGGGRHARPSRTYSRPDKVPMGLLADELWPTPQYVADRGPSGRRRNASRGEQTEAKVADTGVDDEPLGLPSSVVNLYRENLDEDGQAYLARGPRSFEEQLAYAQQVRPGAHENSPRASFEDQMRFRQGRDVDWARNFVGPDGMVYARNDWIEIEKPEARIFRTYENMVGGFRRPSLDDLLNQFDLPDGLTGYSPETQAKIADVESFDRPPSADQAAWEAWARIQGVNPATWFMGERRPESDQIDYQVGTTTRGLPPVVNNNLFIGPDGLMYRRNDLTRDHSGEVGDALEYLRDIWARQDAPPLTAAELLDEALVSGALLPGSNLNRGAPPAWIYGRRPVSSPGGRRGSPITRSDLADQMSTIRRLNPHFTHIAGSRDKDGNELKEEYIPNPGGELLKDGRQRSIWPDSTMIGRRGHVWRLEHATLNRRGKRRGKATPREETKAQKEFRWTQSNGYKDVPWSSVYMLQKRHQLEKLEHPRPGRRKKRKKDHEGKTK